MAPAMTIPNQEQPICSDGLGLWSSNTNTPLAIQPPWPRPRVQRGLLSIIGLQPSIHLPACSSLHGATRNTVWGSTSKADRGGGQPTAVCLSHTRTRPAVSATHRTRVTRQWLVWQVRGLTGRLPRYVAIVTWSSWTHHLGTGISHALHHPIYCFFPLSFHVDTPLCCGPPR